MWAVAALWGFVSGGASLAARGAKHRKRSGGQPLRVHGLARRRDA
jgi:hypothetical protein